MTAQVLDLRLATVDPSLMALRLLRHSPQPVAILRPETVAILLSAGMAHVTFRENPLPRLQTQPNSTRHLVLSDCGRVTLETLERRKERG